MKIVRDRQVTPRAIRFYEELGLIQTQRDKLNRRCLDAINCEKLRIIALLRRGGISLSDIGNALELLRHGRDAQAFQRFIDELSKVRVRELTDQIEAVELARQTILSPDYPFARSVVQRL